MTARRDTPRGSARRAAIYRRAARGMERYGKVAGIWLPDACAYGYACNAIEAVQGRDFLKAESSAAKAFKDVFSPGWANEHGFFGQMEPMRNRNRRIVALCFMAAMVEAGDA